MPGPPRTPTAKLKLSGSWRADARDKVEPKPERGPPPRPDWLDDEGIAAWDQLVPVLDRMRVLTVADGNALALLCDTWSRYRRATREIKEKGEVYEAVTEHGFMLRRSPWSALRSELARMLRGQLAEFGVTPAGRGKVVALPKIEDKDGKGSIFSRRNSA